MKYWNELTELENEIIRLDTLKSLVTVVANGSETSTESDIQNALWHMLGSLEDIVGKLYQTHGELFEAVRDDTADEDESLDFENEIKYNFKPLNDVLNSWASKP